MMFQYRLSSLLVALSALLVSLAPNAGFAQDPLEGAEGAAAEAAEAVEGAATEAADALDGAAGEATEAAAEAIEEAKDATGEMAGEAAAEQAGDALTPDALRTGDIEGAVEEAIEDSPVDEAQAAAEGVDADAVAVVEAPKPHGEKSTIDGVIYVPGDYATITEAIANSEWGDKILVWPGVYQESIVLTEQKGDGLIIESRDGPAETSLAYGAEANVNEAVVTFQRCSNGTQLKGFTIDGRDVAKRGILVNSQSQPVLHDLLISNAEYGIACHRSANPYIQNTTIQKTGTAGLFVQGGGAVVKDARFIAGEKFGVYIRGTIDPVKMRDVRIADNKQVGIQATDGEFSLIGATIENNGDTGIILQDVSPLIQNVTIENHVNVGIVMEASSGRIVNATIRNNNFGLVCSIDGSPTIESCLFEDNPSYHIGIEGAAEPIIGGSQARACQFLGETAYVMQNSSTGTVIATHNFWDKPCVPQSIFQNTGGGKIKKKPWMSGNLLRVFDNCEESRKYNKKWINGKLDAQGNIIKGGGQASASSGDGTEG